MLEELLGGPLLHDVAALHEDHAVGDVAGEAHLVGHDDHRHALLGQLAHDVEDAAHQLGVERARGLVEEHDVGLHRQGARDGHALLLAAGELVGEVVGALGETDAGELLTGDARGLLGAATQHLLLGEHDVVQGVEVREQVELLEHHAHALADVVDVGLGVGDVLALEDNPAARGLLEAVQAAQHSGLARAGGAEHDHDLAAVDVDVDAAQDHGLAEALVQVDDAQDGLLARGDVLLGPAHGGVTHGWLPSRQCRQARATRRACGSDARGRGPRGGA